MRHGDSASGVLLTQTDDKRSLEKTISDFLFLDLRKTQILKVEIYAESKIKIQIKWVYIYIYSMPKVIFT